jgi:2-oxoglutarate dehydrogenase E1 component
MANTAANLFHGPNAGYVLDLYDRYVLDPASVDPETRAFFQTWTPPSPKVNGAAVAAAPQAQAQAAATVDVEHVLQAATYVQAIRALGHQAADISPIGDPTPDVTELPPEQFGLTAADLEALPASIVGGPCAAGAANAREAIERLREVYCGTIGYEHDHVQNAAERAWLREAVESGRFRQPLTAEQQQALLQRLTEVEAFERFLHTTYLGAKRFSVEGTDTLVPMLDEIIIDAAHAGTRDVVIGMAHRGRLNVLAHVLGKPYEAIFAEFEHGPRAGVAASDASATGWTGDVKYHMGLRRQAGPGYGTLVDVPVIMSPNPSHLEYVNPVAEGMTRASQEQRDQPGAPLHQPESALPIVLHGDAAFPGQGIVAETLNLSQLRGYRTGGTIHIIVNNQVGFTTDPVDSRSTLYASDLAKGFEIPVVHVHADDPEACLAVARMAVAYRVQFGRDFLIDLIGYRRWGHNEGDEPTFTQPRLYAEIAARPTVRALWAQQLEAQGAIPSGEGDRLINAALDRLQEIKAQADQAHEARPEDQPRAEGNGFVSNDDLAALGTRETGVSEERLRAYNDVLHSFPEGFTLNSKLERQLQRRRGALEREGGLDWAHAESLAFASILSDGTPIRFTGQDVERGTFSQRHLVLHDPRTGNRFTALQNLPDAASFAVFNSPLSEAAVLGFEYGYSVYAPDALVLWEAQFGDFANSAQVLIDQFIAAGHAKWRQVSALVLLLPHGYEGQGPEHSSGRLERFLQLAAGRNLRVANCTTSAQYFHLLRRQAASLATDPRPLVVMTPKSLLRHPRAGSSLEDLTRGSFQPVIDDAAARGRRERVSRVICCSGKVYVDLTTSQAYADNDGVAVVRVEELHPFPAELLRDVLAGYPGLGEIVWLQEEPKNMGAWAYMAPRLQELVGRETLVRYVGRPERASPAEGSSDVHADEQSRIVTEALEGVRALEMHD